MSKRSKPTPDQLLMCGSTQQQKVHDNAVDRVRLAHESAKGELLYVAFSGGKDSVCLRGIVEEAAEADRVPLRDYAEFHYNITGVDPPELIKFMAQTYGNVKLGTGDLHWDMYKKSMWRLIEEKGPPTRRYRICCAELKEGGGDGRMCCTGVRWAESVKRASKRAAYENFTSSKSKKVLMNDDGEARRYFESCTLRAKRICNPIVDWTHDNVWEYIYDRSLAYCELYDEGFDRLGCVGCPMAGNKRWIEFKRWPAYQGMYIRAFDRFVQRRLSGGAEFTQKWTCGQDVFDWWMQDKNLDKQIEGQETME